MLWFGLGESCRFISFRSVRLCFFSTKAPTHHQTFQNPINRSAIQSNHRCHSQNAQAIKMMAA
jgi:hypothetical protein